jgi:hypothetical protein
MEHGFARPTAYAALAPDGRFADLLVEVEGLICLATDG